MAILGMDVDQVAGAATQLDGHAQSIAASMTGVDRIVDGTLEQWFGPDAQAFVQDWYAQHRPALVAAQAAVGQLVTAARRNVAEQQQASGGGVTADGRLDVRERSVVSGAGPRDVKSLLGLIPGAYAQPGGVSVTFQGDGAARRAIVTVSGTEDWDVGGTNPDDMSTNIGNAFGAHTLKQEAIAAAMADAGVRSTDQVLLVGHSQGGADAIDFASDPTNTARYDITGVVTAGAPETVVYPKPSIPVLELRTDGDLVPTLGASSAAGLAAAGLPGAIIGHAVHDATMPTNVTVSELPGGYELPWTAHRIATYIDDAGHISDPAVGAFVTAHPGFFDGSASTTYTYSAQRVGDGAVRYR